MKGVITTKRRDAVCSQARECSRRRQETSRTSDVDANSFSRWLGTSGMVTANSIAAGFKRMRRKWSAPLRTCASRCNSAGAYSHSHESSAAPATHKPVAASPAKTCEACPGSVPEADARQICSSGHVPGPSEAKASKRRAAVPGHGAAHRTMSASDGITLARAAGPPCGCPAQLRRSREVASGPYPTAVPGRRQAPRATAADFLQCRMFRES